MLSRILVTVGIVFYAFAVPALEINATHVFNPATIFDINLGVVGFGLAIILTVLALIISRRTRQEDAQ